MQGDKPFGIDLHNGVFNSLSDYQASKPDVTLEIAKPELLAFLAGKVTMDALLNEGKAKVSGDAKVLEKLPGLFDLTIKNNMNLVLPLQQENRIKE